jgi:hypothetical protein
MEREAIAMDVSDRSAAVTMQDRSWQFFYRNQTVLTVSAAYPVVSIPGARWVQERINAVVRGQVSRFYRNASGPLYRQAVREYRDSQAHDFPFRPYDAVLKYEVPFNRDCHLSLYRDQYEYTGGAHGNTVRASDTWNLETGRRLPLSHFFRPGENYRKTVLDEILRQADEAMADGSGMLFEDYRTLLRKYFNPSSYFLAQDGVSVYYQQYEVAPYAAGIVVFSVPYGVEPSCAKR